jgi:hypothetical protein
MRGSSQFPILTDLWTSDESKAEFGDINGLSVMNTLNQSSLLIDLRIEYQDI